MLCIIYVDVAKCLGGVFADTIWKQEGADMETSASSHTLGKMLLGVKTGEKCVNIF